jgi:predicted ATPase
VCTSLKSLADNEAIMYIRSLKVRDLRAVANGNLDLLYPGREKDKPFSKTVSWPARLPNVNILLGENGAGKSTMLAAAALAILSPLIAQSGYRPYSLIRRTENGAHPKDARIDAQLMLHPQDGVTNSRFGTKQSVETIVERRGDVELIRGVDEQNQIWEGMFNDTSPAFLLVGYGATRRVETLSSIDPAARSKTRQLRYERVASLFENNFTLRPLASWLPEWQSKNPGRYKQVINLINKLSRDGVRFSGTLERGEYLFQVGKTAVPFSALSDGFKAYIGWIGDLLYHVCMGCPSGKKLVDNKGVVLVDEIDLHIHPAWQQTIIPTLAQSLPNLQFIFTSHSPLVVGTLESANIIHVEISRSGKSIMKRPDEEVYGLSADQILRSDVFGLSSTRDLEFKEQLDELSKKATSGDRAAAMAFMRLAAGGQGAATVNSDDTPEPPEWVKTLAAMKSAS